MTDFRRLHAEISIIGPESQAIQCIVSIEVFKVYIVVVGIKSFEYEQKLNRKSSKCPGYFSISKH